MFIRRVLKKLYHQISDGYIVESTFSLQINEKITYLIPISLTEKLGSKHLEFHQ